MHLVTINDVTYTISFRSSYSFILLQDETKLSELTATYSKNLMRVNICVCVGGGGGGRAGGDMIDPRLYCFKRSQ